jgi:hypothetical protein
MDNKNLIVTQDHSLEIVSIDKEVLSNLQKFQKQFLQNEPVAQELRINKYANNSRYLPISFMEMTLDEIFFGLWQTKNFTSRTVANEEVGSLELWYFHPVAKTWLCRIGAGAVQIQMISKEKGGTGDITNIKDKITNTLTKDYPHLKAECFRNACLSIGKLFGRDLNREFDDEYVPIIREVKEPTEEERKNEENKRRILEVSRKIINEIDHYKGTDKETIKKECALKLKDSATPLSYYESVAQKIGVKL